LSQQLKKLIPEFDENDVETFLITFEKIAGINKFPTDKYAAILQAHLKGKALKVFTELSLTVSGLQTSESGTAYRLLSCS